MNLERVSERRHLLPRAEITLLGQFSLLANPKIPVELKIPATMDLDAMIDAEWVIKDAFKKILRDEGLVYDEDSHLIWIPEGSQFVDLYTSDSIRVKAIEPLYALLSKAIKAREKNRFLVGQAIGIYGETLVKLIWENGGDVEYFLKD